MSYSEGKNKQSKKKNSRYARRRRILSAFLVWALAIVSVQAALPGAWGQARKEYESGRYAEAASLFEQILNEGYASPEVYHNLGLCYARTTQWGKSVLALERALRLAPNALPVQQSLQSVRRELPDQIEGFAEYAWLERLKNPQKVASARTWAMAAAIGFWMALVLWFFRSRVPLASVQRFLPGIALALLISGGICLAIAWYSDFKENDWRWAIVMGSETAIHQGPDVRSPEQRLIHEGAKVYILETLEDWAKIRLENGDEGWMDSGAIQSIVPE